MAVFQFYLPDVIWKSREIKKHFVTEFHSLYIWLCGVMDGQMEGGREGAAFSDGNFLNKILMKHLKSPWHEKSWNCQRVFLKGIRRQTTNFHLCSLPLILIAKGVWALLVKPMGCNSCFLWKFVIHTMQQDVQMWVDCWSCSQFKKEVTNQEQFTYVWQASMQGNPALLQWGKITQF